MGFSFVDQEKNTDKPQSLIVWRENEPPLWVFIEVAHVHNQWLYVGMDANLIGLDGNYLLSYLRARFKKKKAISLHKLVMWIANGYVAETAKQRRKNKN